MSYDRSPTMTASREPANPMADSAASITAALPAPEPSSPAPQTTSNGGDRAKWRRIRWAYTVSFEVATASRIPCERSDPSRPGIPE